VRVPAPSSGTSAGAELGHQRHRRDAGDEAGRRDGEHALVGEAVRELAPAAQDEKVGKLADDAEEQHEPRRIAGLLNQEDGEEGQGEVHRELP
jgi:hypothetical protein